jgi:hypothetical protein
LKNDWTGEIINHSTGQNILISSLALICHTCTCLQVQVLRGGAIVLTTAKRPCGKQSPSLFLLEIFYQIASLAMTVSEGNFEMSSRDILLFNGTFTNGLSLNVRMTSD